RHRFLSRRRPPADERGRRRGRAAAPKERADHARKRPRAHEDDEGVHGGGEPIPVHAGPIFRLVARHHGERRGPPSASERDAGVGGYRDRGAHTGDDLERDPGDGERLGLLRSPTEHERVTALEPDDPAPEPGVADQERMDHGLGQGVVAAALARKHAQGLRGRLGRNPGIDQAVIDDDLGGPQDLEPPNREEARISGPRADEVDRAYGHGAVSRATSRARASAPSPVATNWERSPPRARCHAAGSGRRPRLLSSRRTSAASRATSAYSGPRWSSRRSRTARASAGLAPPVPTATTSSPRRRTDGTMKSQRGRSSAVLTQIPAVRASRAT